MIQIENLNKSYTLKTGLIRRTNKVIQALSDINLSINNKETIGLIGLNGAGKSTLIKVILGILKPDTGYAHLLGRDAVKYREKNMAQVGVVFGQRSQLRWDVSPYDAYLLNKAIYKIDHQDFMERLNKYADILEIKDFWQRPVRTLSLGQKMRAELLASILHHPKLLILDEPTIGVDVISKRKIINLINELKKDMTLIFTSHNLKDVYELCDRFVILNQGKIILDENKNSISQRIGYVSIHLTLAKPGIHSEALDNYHYQLQKLNDFEYVLHEIAKNDLTAITPLLFAHHQIDDFSLKENDLETLLTTFAKEVQDNESNN